MNKTKHKLKVPDRVKYLSDWKELDNLLVGDHIIVNKKITGCGATSYFLNHPSMKVILCSPRLLLLEDKFKQCKQFTHWFRNGDSQEMETITEEADSENKSKKPLEIYNDNLRRYLVNTKVPKILVTYDSLKYVLNVIKESEKNLDDYTIVVDEFHSIFQDCKFKPDTELSLLDVLKSVKRVIYLSATPINDEYLIKVDDFKNLPYYELVWPENRIIKANINRLQVDNLVSEAIKIINTYLAGLYPTKIINGDIIESKEAVIYLNSIKDIISILKKTKLSKDIVNILCSKNDNNSLKLKKLGGYTIGSIPKRGEQHKMFTFCTRTAFLGTDFYSTCASSYIFADPNIDSLSLDISMDIPQIIGRQRNESNPFRNDITLFYKTKNILEDNEKFKEHIDNKIKGTYEQIDNFKIIKSSKGSVNKFLEAVRSLTITSKYSTNYAGISGDTIKFNNLVYLSDLRSWEIQQMNFKDGYTLLNTLENEGFVVNERNINENEYTKFYKDFTDTRSFEIKMRLYCEMVEKVGLNQTKCFNFIPAKFHNFFNTVGLEKLKALKYREKSIEDYISIKKVEGKLYKILIKNFRVGDRISLSDIKNTLGIIYSGLNINITPKATDLSKFFEVKRINLNQKKEGLEIISHTLNINPKDNISLFNRVYNSNNPTITNINDIFNIIKIGSNGLKESIEEIRKCSNHQEQNNLKYLNLPVVCWNGTFEKRNNGSLIEYSSYLMLDIDNIQNNLDNYRSYFKQIPYVKSVFLSPSGNGLKVLVQHNNIDPAFHKELFKALFEKLNIKELDWSVSDLARGNYLSYDPDIYINEECASYKFTPTYIEFPKLDKKLIYKVSDNSLEDNRILGCLDSYWKKNFPESHKEGNRHSSVLRQAVKLNRVGIEINRSLYYLISSFVTLPELEIQNIINYVYTENVNEFGIDRNSFKM